jgi:hypothetical protein
MLFLLREDRVKRTAVAKKNGDKVIAQKSDDPFFSKNYTNIRNKF